MEKNTNKRNIEKLSKLMAQLNMEERNKFFSFENEEVYCKNVVLFNQHLNNDTSNIIFSYSSKKKDILEYYD